MQYIITICFFAIDNQQRHINNYQSQQYHYMSRFDIKKGAENEDYEVTSGTFHMLGIRYSYLCIAEVYLGLKF